MKLIVADTYEEMSRLAADEIAAVIEAKPDCVLGLATGTTPIGLYADLVKRYEAGDLSFAKCQSFNLDEYCGLEGTHPQSYRYFMQQNLFDHVDIDVAKTHTPDAQALDVKDGVDAYDRAIEEAGGVDIQLLNEQSVTLRNIVLLATGHDDCLHTCCTYLSFITDSLSGAACVWQTLVTHSKRLI